MKKKGFMRVVLALLMSMLLIVSTGCGKSGNGGSSSGKKSGKTATLADIMRFRRMELLRRNSLRPLQETIKRYSLKGQQMMELHISGRMTVQRFRIQQIRI